MKKKFKSIIDDEVPVLVDFHAEWCGPCKMMAPILAQVKENLGETVKIIKIDVDKNQSLASTYSVHGVPTLILFHQVKIAWRKSGVVDKQTLLNVIKKSA